MPSGQTVRLDFDSTFEMLDLVQVVSDHIARLAGLDEGARHWVNVAVRESVINAIKHGNSNDSGKRVHVEFTPLETGEAPQGVLIRVRDEGPGLTSEQQRRIFEPFFTTKTKGTGLGMAIAQRIVHSHGGAIAASSPQGAQIEIRLPRGEV